VVTVADVRDINIGSLQHELDVDWRMFRPRHEDLETLLELLRATRQVYASPQTVIMKRYGTPALRNLCRKECIAIVEAQQDEQKDVVVQAAKR